MRQGFLIIDRHKNTIFIEREDFNKSLNDIFANKIGEIKRHKTKCLMTREIDAYLKGIDDYE